MSSSCTLGLVGVASLVSELWLPFKNGQIFLSDSPWSWRNLINRNRLKKFMQVRVDIECMRTDFGGRGLSSFGDKISLWFIIVEKFNRSELAQIIYASRG